MAREEFGRRTGFSLIFDRVEARTILFVCLLLSLFTFIFSALACMALHCVVLEIAAVANELARASVERAQLRERDTFYIPIVLK